VPPKLPYRSTEDVAKTDFAKQRFPERFHDVSGSVPASQNGLPPDVVVCVCGPPNFVDNFFENAVARFIPICIA
jgi:hypothetical protein